MSQGSSRFDWYQTDAEVCINYFRKNLKPEDVRVEFETDSVTIFAVTENGEEPLKTFHLLHSVSKSDSSFRVSSVKVELRLRKLTAARWDRLESDSSLTDTEKPCSSPDNLKKVAHSYPSSSRVAHDWDKLGKEAAELDDGIDPLNKLFQDIYSNASEETKRAMIKSFTESAGTVLSTNWNEVGKGRVEMKPPDGMEYKKYEI
ncbi:unnamed protein product [Dicrocoelium dendriticum]|nr:unnamed protein product [Dicrocoelium dendriticum]